MVNEKRLIDAKPLMEDGWHLVKTGKSNVFLASMSLADVPTVDAAEMVHGRWIDGFFKNTVECSVCFENGICKCYETKHNYCPNCGAKMDGKREDGVGDAIVRCKDCDWYREDGGICVNPRCGKSFYGCQVLEQHFCSYGERREGE